MTLEKNQSLDLVDLRLLRELQQNARLSYAELGRRIGLSIPAITERVRKLEDAGIIQGYHARVDPQKIGLPVTAFIRMHTTGERSLYKMKAVIAGCPEVVECYHLSGEDYYLLKVHTETLGQLEKMVEKLQLYGQTTTSIVLSEILASKSIAGGKLDGGMQPAQREDSRLPLKARISRFRSPD